MKKVKKGGGRCASRLAAVLIVKKGRCHGAGSLDVCSSRCGAVQRLPFKYHVASWFFPTALAACSPPSSSAGSRYAPRLAASSSCSGRTPLRPCPEQVAVLEAQAAELQQAEKAAAAEAADADAETGAAEQLRAARLAEEQRLRDGREAVKRRDAERQQKDAEVADGRLAREVATKMTEDLEAQAAARLSRVEASSPAAATGEAAKRSRRKAFPQGSQSPQTLLRRKARRVSVGGTPGFVGAPESFGTVAPSLVQSSMGSLSGVRLDDAEDIVLSSPAAPELMEDEVLVGPTPQARDGVLVAPTPQP